MGCCGSGALPAGGTEDGGGCLESTSKPVAPSDGRSPEAPHSLSAASTSGTYGAAPGATSSSCQPGASEAALPAKANSGSSMQSSGFSRRVGGADEGARILSRITVQPYGILGTQRLKRTGRVEDRAGPPGPGAATTSGPDVVILDPAGLPYIMEGPASAGGASGAIYEWLGIRSDPSFPEDVVKSINQPRTAKLHVYGEKACIHCVGPDFNKAGNGNSYEWALGQFVYEMPQLTSQALQQAFADMNTEQQAFILQDAELDMCIFLEKELPEYQAALQA